MYINSDFSLQVSIKPNEYEWIASPQAGIERVMLDRIGGERGRATSLVRYAPNASYPEHPHPGGEEILVLSGTFSEGEHDYPAGWYLRNPPGSIHQPYSRVGALIFVKLQQMHADDLQRVRIDTSSPSSWRHHGDELICPLYESLIERVWLQHQKARGQFSLESFNGLELLVLNGEILIDGMSFERGSWIRLPATDLPRMSAGPSGVTVYFKTGHLAR